jgi:hypothetical protein
MDEVEQPAGLEQRRIKPLDVLSRVAFTGRVVERLRPLPEDDADVCDSRFVREVAIMTGMPVVVLQAGRLPATILAKSVLLANSNRYD